MPNNSALTAPAMYAKQNKLLNYTSPPSNTSSIFLETNKYYLVFIHPETEVNNGTQGITTYTNLFIPAYNIDQPPMVGSVPVQVPFSGEIIHFSPSATAYNPMQATLFDTEDLKVRKYLQELLLSYARPNSKTRLMTVAIVIYDHNDDYITTIELSNAFISSIGAVELNWDSPSQIATYPVTIEFAYFDNTINDYSDLQSEDSYTLALSLFKENTV